MIFHTLCREIFIGIAAISSIPIHNHAPRRWYHAAGMVADLDGKRMNLFAMKHPVEVIKIDLMVIAI